MNELLAFLGICALVIVTPGQDTALTIRNTLVAGRTAGVMTAVGVSAGQLVWALATTVGLAALLIASEPAFNALRLVGAAYLVFLGGRALLTAVLPNRFESDRATDQTASRPLSRVVPFRQGLLSNLGNPKMAVFFTSLLPQFTALYPPLLLGLVFVTMTLLWLSGYSWVVGRAAALLLRRSVRRALDAVMGAVLLVFGVRLVAQAR